MKSLRPQQRKPRPTRNSNNNNNNNNSRSSTTLSNTKKTDHEILKDVNEIHDTGACYGVAKCAEIVFEPGKMVRVEGLQVLEKRMESMDPDENEIYKFLGIEQADGIKTKRVYERVKHEVTKRVRMLINTELNHISSVRAINAK